VSLSRTRNPHSTSHIHNTHRPITHAATVRGTLQLAQSQRHTQLGIRQSGVIAWPTAKDQATHLRRKQKWECATDFPGRIRNRVHQSAPRLAQTNSFAVLGVAIDLYQSSPSIRFGLIPTLVGFGVHHYCYLWRRLTWAWDLGWMSPAFRHFFVGRTLHSAADSSITRSSGGHSFHRPSHAAVKLMPNSLAGTGQQCGRFASPSRSSSPSPCTCAKILCPGSGVNAGVKPNWQAIN